MILQEILPTVTRPARYIGNELHAVKKETPSFKVALVYPDVYERGMSHLTTRILYHLLNRDEEIQCERVFAPWRDMKERLLREGLPLFSLESHTPLKSFPLIFILLNDPLSYTTILDLLNLAQIPLQADSRFEDSPKSDNLPIIIGGGSCSYNPEPMAPFFDGFWIGDGEEVVPEIVKTVKESSIHIRKEEVLSALSKIEGLYIPRFPKTVRTRIVSTLRKEDIPTVPIVPFIEIDRDSLLIEIERHNVTRPVPEVVEVVQEGFRETGWEKIAFLSSPSPSSLSELLISLAPFIHQNHITLTLPPVQPHCLSDEVISALKDVRRGPLHLLPRIGNGMDDLSESDLIQTVERASKGGFQRIHLHFEIGDPEEGEGRLLKVSHLCREASKAAGHGIQITITPFIPRPHTEGERKPLIGIEALLEKERFLKSALGGRSHRLLVKMPKVEGAFLRGLLVRGDRFISKVIEGVYRSGGSLETWNECFSYNRWVKTFEEMGLDPEEEARRWESRGGVTPPLPWDFILPPKESKESGVQRVESVKSKDSTDSRLNIRWGRKKRRLPALSPFSNLRLRVCFSKGEEVRYLSHLDLMRTIHRSLRRARIPVAYSQGFTPRPKVSFGPPLSVGMTGRMEYFDLLLSEPLSALRAESGAGRSGSDDFVLSLNRVLPKGLSVHEAEPIFPQASSLTEILNIAVYRVAFGGRNPPSPSSQLDPRPGKHPDSGRLPPDLLDLKESEGSVEMVLRIGEGVKMGPKEVLMNLLGLTMDEVHQCTIERTDLYLTQDDQWVRP